MKIVKNIFLISLVNFALLVSILLYFSRLGQTVPPVIRISPTPFITAKPTLTTTPTTTSTPTPTPDPLSGHCIITVDGSRYDFTVFRNLHSGGDVFTCGADMSRLFHEQHPNSLLSRMARYKI
ncbi:MAG: hypothetical protein UW16_C0003G0024 [Microgenomates group bacterium GW2011_GWC1_44_10]|uniref:Cytochrome b5 heme-binding domain-containing protein n=1 Tax=Candidatus Woesebacteria bacterium GW2011_GWA2_44_33 TaxID=1618564 RepID=A0A0G1M5W8_9BACT|nr:MAG: hypothetical protein UW16_C0003G0024 [Microgenomates group bacterium GW2011_GWC1_44_10]KKT67309.1 MAG: hypothetical protein UW60_C0009G0015 [Candidatus Woesebacteria bacterium GW2011_GWA2_44_33]